MSDNPNNTEQSGNNWEREAIVKLANSALDEQKKTRRWGLFFKFLMFAYLFAILWLYTPKDWKAGNTADGSHTALVELAGVIAPDAEASADRIIPALRNAFEDENTKGVILRINSPGGSPVQSGYINDEIKRLRKAHPEIPLYAVITDICASGGYYIAAAADKIYADKASLVGSIGVIMNGFGFVDTMEKLGVERRLITAGDHKGFLDPFTPVNDTEKKHVEDMLGDIHNQFIRTVKEGRGDRLKYDKDTFSGLIWTGERSVELGLVDALGSSSYVAREIIGAEEIVDFTTHEPYFEKLAKQMGASASTQIFGQQGSFWLR
ncbi:MAG: signal peptide peptidase SppA [Gammaproteobacteria bacterium]